MPALRLHVRAMVRDGSAAFVGSQSLRKLELDGRREVGVIVSDTAIAKRMQEVFEADWLKTLSKSEVKEVAAAENGKSDKEQDKAKVEDKSKEASGTPRRASRYCALAPRDHPRIDHLSRARDRVEVELVAGDFRRQERLFRRVGRSGEAGVL